MTNKKEIIEKLEETEEVEEKKVKKPKVETKDVKEKKTKKAKKKNPAIELDEIMGTSGNKIQNTDEVPEFMSLEENNKDIPDYLKY